MVPGHSCLARPITSFISLLVAWAAFPGAGGGDVLRASSADENIGILLKVAHAQGPRAGLDGPELATERPRGPEIAEVPEHVRASQLMPAPTQNRMIQL